MGPRLASGQTSRVDAVHLAIRRAGEHAGSRPCVVASDAFFPFADGLLAAIEAGATAAIQPGGSVRDQVVAAADQAGIAMLFTGIRHFAIEARHAPTARRPGPAHPRGLLRPSPYRNADLGGTVSWQEKIVYGPDATLIVYLVDASGPETTLRSTCRSSTTRRPEPSSMQPRSRE